MKFNGLVFREGAKFDAGVDRESLAYIRAYLDGIDLRTLECRYAGQASDVANVRDARARLKRIRTALSLMAKRYGRDARDVRLLWIDPEKLIDTAPQMSLEEFQFERDPDGFYSEAELIELYADEVGANASNNRLRIRNERIRRRQLSILAWIEMQVPAAPAQLDKLSACIDDQVADRLAVAGIQTIADLAKRISHDGRNWWKPINRLGRKTAAALETWVRGFQGGEAQFAIGPDPLRTLRSTPKAGIVPFEWFDATLTFPQEHRILATYLARLEAVGGPNTYRTYRREIERFFLFCALELDQPFLKNWTASVSRYRDFVKVLGTSVPDAWPFRIPQADWIGPRHSERRSLAWRPFSGPLGPASQRLAVDAVQACMRSLAI
jgi:hypothetical protein